MLVWGLTPARLAGRFAPRLVAVTVVVVAVLAVAAPASAHAQLESTEPVASSVLTQSPAQVVLHFGEPVETDFGSLEVIGPSGQRVDEGGAHHPGGDSHSVAISLPRLPDGTYIVAWHVISADSHPVHGAFYFSVGTARGAGHAQRVAGALATANGPVSDGVVYFIVRAVSYISLLVLVGLAAMVVVARPRGVPARRARRIVVWSWAVLAVLTVFVIALQGVYAAELPLGDVVRPSLFREVLGTHFGQVELLRLLLLAAAAVVGWVLLSAAARGDRARWWWVVAGAALGVGLVATSGLAGHASTGSSPVWGMALDLVHLSAVALWVGGLVLLVAVFVRTSDPPSEADASRVARRVSQVALLAVVAVVASGTLQAIRQVGSFYALFNTDYGRTLIVKVCLVAVVVLVATASRRAVHGDLALPFVSRRRRAAASGGTVTVARRRLVGSVLAELAILVAVLGVTAVLVNDVPAGQAASLPYTQTFDVLGVQVNAVVSPARPGPSNEFHFYVLGSDGQPKAIPELDVSLSLPSKGIGPITVPVTVAGPGHYQDNQVTIPFAGDWDLDLTVRTSPIDEQEVQGVIAVH